MSRSLKILLAIDIAFLILHIIPTGSEFNLDAEYNWPTLYQTLKLVSVGLINLAIFFKVRRVHAFPALFLGSVFLFLGADEWFQIHESIGVTFREWLANSLQLEFNFAEWILIYLPLMFIALAIFYFAWRRLKVDIRQFRIPSSRLFIAAVICFAFVPLAELIGTWNWNFDAPYYSLIVMVEEGLEMVGASLFIAFSLAYLGFSVKSQTLTPHQSYS